MQETRGLNAPKKNYAHQLKPFNWRKAAVLCAGAGAATVVVSTKVRIEQRTSSLWEKKAEIHERVVKANGHGEAINEEIAVLAWRDEQSTQATREGAFCAIAAMLLVAAFMAARQAVVRARSGKECGERARKH
jgi:hypothetical protein